jgi:hypothetical protein
MQIYAISGFSVCQLPSNWWKMAADDSDVLNAAAAYY